MGQIEWRKTVLGGLGWSVSYANYWLSRIRVDNLNRIIQQIGVSRDNNLSIVN